MNFIYGNVARTEYRLKVHAMIVFEINVRNIRLPFRWYKLLRRVIQNTKVQSKGKCPTVPAAGTTQQKQVLKDDSTHTTCYLNVKMYFYG